MTLVNRFLLGFAFAAAFLLTGVGYASDPWNAESKFNMSKNKVSDFRISVKPVSDVNKACNEEARRRGFPGYKFSVDACTFWSGDFKNCVIFTQKNTTMHILGHELRHCLVGDFH